MHAAIRSGTVGESMTVGDTSSRLPKTVEAAVENDPATDVSSQTNSTDETFELLFTQGNAAMQEEDGDVEVEDEDEEDEEGRDVSTYRSSDATGDGHASNSTVHDRRKKKRNRRRVRKRNATSNAAAVNEVVVEGVKPAIPSSPTKANTGTGNTSSSSQQGPAQANQRSKKPHDAPMTKSDLYYSIRCEMVPVEVEVRQSLPAVKSGQDSDPSESAVVVATIVRHVIGRVLLVNWDKVKVYDALVVPELSSSQLTLLQEEFKSSQWSTTTSPYTFHVKRAMDDRTETTGMEPAANVSPVSISALKPILKKIVKGKIVIGYHVPADLQAMDGMAHPKTDVRDLAQCRAYMSTIVTARPMSLHCSQDRQSIVHYEPKPLSVLIATYVDSSYETHPKLLHQDLLYKEAVACLFLYKRVRSEWEDELSRSSRFRYKFPPMVAKASAFAMPGKSSAEELSLLPPPISRQELWIPRPPQPLHHARPPMLPQCGYDPSQPSMMNILPGDLPNNRNNSLPMSSYHSSTTTLSYVPVDRDFRVAQYIDRRHHTSHTTFPEFERWNHDHASIGALPVDAAGSPSSSLYHKAQLPVSSLAAPPHPRTYFGPNEYGTCPPTAWNTHRPVETNREVTERLTTNEGMRWMNAHEDLPNFYKAATSPPEYPWRTTSSLHRPDEASIIPSPLISEPRPFSRIGTPNCLGSFDGVVHRNDRLPTTFAINTWSPLATESFPLQSILKKSSVATSSDTTDTQQTSPAPPRPLARVPTTTTTSVLAPTSDHHAFGDTQKDVSQMFEWSSLLASINDE